MSERKEDSIHRLSETPDACDVKRSYRYRPFLLAWTGRVCLSGTGSKATRAAGCPNAMRVGREDDGVERGGCVLADEFSTS